MDHRRDNPPDPEPAAAAGDGAVMDPCWRCGELVDASMIQIRAGYDVCPRCAREMQER